MLWILESTSGKRFVINELPMIDSKMDSEVLSLSKPVAVMDSMCRLADCSICRTSSLTRSSLISDELSADIDKIVLFRVPE